MNDYKKIFFVIVSFFLILTGCSEDETSSSGNDLTRGNESKETFEEDQDNTEIFNVEFSGNLSLSDDENLLHIDIETNLLDGTKMVYSVQHTEFEDQSTGNIMELENNEIKEDVDISEFSNGDINIMFGMVMANQEDHILEAYGENGENLNGDFIFTENGISGLHFEEFLRKTAPVEISGSGDTATDTFGLAEGFVVVAMNYVGDGNFVANLTDMSGGEKLVANWIGGYDGKTLSFIDDGEYYLEVKANGDWSATLTQTIPDDVGKTPGTFEGFGDDVIFVEMTEGNKRFHFTHNGESNFTIQINDDSLIANGIGNYEGSSTENIPEDSIYALNVQGDGDWAIEIEDF